MSKKMDDNKEKGVSHWKRQRKSAIVIFPLTLWLIFSLIHHLGAPYEVAHQWVAQPVVAIGIAVFVMAMFYHTKLGLQVIIEDYIATLSSRNSILRISNLICWLAMITGLVSIAVIFFLA